MVTTGTNVIEADDLFLGLNGEVRTEPKFFKREGRARQSLLRNSGIEKTLEELQ